MNALRDAVRNLRRQYEAARYIRWARHIEITVAVLVAIAAAAVLIEELG